MPQDMHSLEVADGATPTARTDRRMVAFLPASANAAGAGEGDAATITDSERVRYAPLH
jgi:hypothetical protein